MGSFWPVMYVVVFLSAARQTENTVKLWFSLWLRKLALISGWLALCSPALYFIQITVICFFCLPSSPWSCVIEKPVSEVLSVVVFSHYRTLWLNIKGHSHLLKLCGCLSFSVIYVAKATSLVKMCIGIRWERNELCFKRYFLDDLGPLNFRRTMITFMF